jgi:hypothetical protein
MSASNQLAVFLPFVLAAVLVGIALAGPRLAPGRRRSVSRTFQAAMFLAALAMIGLYLVQGQYLSAAVLAMSFFFVLLRVLTDKDVKTPLNGN